MVTVSSAELGVRVTVAVVPGTVIVSSVVRVAWTVTISCSGVELKIEEADVLAANGVAGNWLTSGLEAGPEVATVLTDALGVSVVLEVRGATEPAFKPEDASAVMLLEMLDMVDGAIVSWGLVEMDPVPGVENVVASFD